ncbi:MAG TPA: prolipoprotein diacylglyceryl transferase [Candidatus Limnocylindrales bacterium]|nr:prolipoprotein diacylglyceryl transferase [Candidatus Limnocylindrales bacterium]
MIDWTPSAVALQLGPFSLYWYGIAYAVGIAGAYWAVTRQARVFGQDTRIVGNGIIIVAIAALIGGRLYHVIDQWQLYANDPIKIILPPYSGLGIFGGLITGGLAFLVLARRWHLSAWRWADIVATGIFVMQAAGRVGNFFNQELYGPPTNLPWGIAIDCAHRVVEYPCETFPLATTHFQPLFLYESLSGLLGAATLLWLASRPRPWLRVGDLGAIMFIWIGGVRFLVEFLRINNWRLADIPTAQLFGAAFAVLGIAMLVIRRLQHAPILEPMPAFVALEVEAAGEPRDIDAADDAGDDFAEFDAAQRSRDDATGGRSPG